ncbi:MAG: hypothetical protein CLLPBCKN_003883 [Chroococcidiopsis cubana SAG 39.79]|nr:hypothetical protein [Chroococcidiopsis cubana SAG 39.79]
MKRPLTKSQNQIQSRLLPQINSDSLQSTGDIDSFALRL